MTGDALIAEGQRLARPCVHLRPDGEQTNFAAVWRGPGQVPASDGAYEHWLTIDCRWLPSGVGPSSGCLSVYTENEEYRHGAVAHDASGSLSLTQGGGALHAPTTSLLPRRRRSRRAPAHTGRALYAHTTSSLPPLEAVFLNGSAAVREWLARIGWQPEWGWNGNFPDAKVVNAYIEAQRNNMPIDGKQVFAVLGGWHEPWPDGDWLELVDRPLVDLTLAESEPWVEVFNMGGEFKVFQRIS